jgi:signal transduction histidine kinase
MAKLPSSDSLPSIAPARSSGRLPLLLRAGARRWFLVESIVALIVAIVIDLFADLPYVMTPLYAIPVLLIAYTEEPRLVAAMGVVATAVNLASALADGTPAEVSAFYGIGLALTAYLAFVFAIHKREAELRAREAREARNTLETVVSMIAHDLSGSLTPLIAFSELMQLKQLTPEDQVHALASINSGAYRVNRLARDLSATSSMLAGRFQVHPAQMDLLEISREVIRLQQAVSGRSITLQAPAHLEGVWDRDRVAQVLTNLISNAVKYSPSDAVVEIEIGLDERWVAVSVRDHGIGMSHEDQGRLFRPFSRIVQDESIEGIGLGLHIARGIVEAHGGTIDVESQPGIGSTFTVHLPMCEPASAVAAPRPLDPDVADALDRPALSA